MIHVGHFLTELSIPYSLPMKLYADNQAAQAAARNPEFHARLKHVDIAYHFQREKLEEGLIAIEHTPTEKMAADGLIKPLGKLKFKRFVQQLQLST